MKLLLVTPTSVSVELENNDCYSTDSYEVFLNGECVGAKTENVFSLYNLSIGEHYHLEIRRAGYTEQAEFDTLPYKEVVYHSTKDGTSENDTQSLQKAIDALTENQFLTILGTYRVTALFLRDNTMINLSKGSKLIGETDRTLFPILSSQEELNGIVKGTWEGCADDSFASIITGLGVSHCCIYGEGVIDCNAHNSDWWINHREKRIARRPKGIFLHTCRDITLEGITVCNTPSWNQHPFYSKDLKYINLTLINPPNSPTTDGIDPESCDNVLIVGTKISVGDDCIAIKSGKLDFARKYRTPSTNITVRNCLMERGHAGVTLGSENSGGINNVLVTKCVFSHTDRGLRIKSQRGRGDLAVIEEITFRNILMSDVKSPFVINAFYKAGNDVEDDRFYRGLQPITDLTPQFGEFLFEDIRCKDVSFGVGFFLGLPESPIQKVSLHNVEISFKVDAEPGEMAMTAWKETFCKVGFVCENLDELELQSVEFLNNPSEKFVLKTRPDFMTGQKLRLNGN